MTSTQALPGPATARDRPAAVSGPPRDAPSRSRPPYQSRIRARWSPFSLEEWIPPPYVLADFEDISLKLQVFFGMVDEYESYASGLTIRGVTPILDMCDEPECQPSIVEAPIGVIALDPPA